MKKAVKSYEKRITQHEGWIKDPRTKNPNFYSIPWDERESYVEIKWPNDITRLREEKEVIEGILRERGKA